MKQFYSSSSKKNRNGPQHHDDDDDEEEEESSDVSLAFFELANAPAIGYRLPPLVSETKDDDDDDKDAADSERMIVLHQDVTACGEHTGGIVWETSFLLLEYLLHQYPRSSTEGARSLGRTLEVGAGCGLLGQVLAAANRTCDMIVTETAQVLVNLQANLERNRTVLQLQSTTCTTTGRSSSSSIRACCLDWEHYERDAAANNLTPHSFDTILGTDVLFATRFVEPLLLTMQYLSLSTENTDTDTTTSTSTNTFVMYLCVQVRCAASHRLFLDKAPSYGFHVHDISEECFAVPSCEWGRDLDCKIFRITRL
jgi:hypothetical protein